MLTVCLCVCVGARMAIEVLSSVQTWIPAGIDARFAGCMSIALTIEPRLLLSSHDIGGTGVRRDCRCVLFSFIWFIYVAVTVCFPPTLDDIYFIHPWYGI